MHELMLTALSYTPASSPRHPHMAKQDHKLSFVRRQCRRLALYCDNISQDKIHSIRRKGYDKGYCGDETSYGDARDGHKSRKRCQSDVGMVIVSKKCSTDLYFR